MKFTNKTQIQKRHAERTAFDAGKINGEKENFRNYQKKQFYLGKFSENDNEGNTSEFEDHVRVSTYKFSNKNLMHPY